MAESCPAEPEDVSPDASLPDDEALAVAVQGGCVASYEELDRRYRGRLVHLLRRRVGRGGVASAEDLAQATLWTAYCKIDRFDASRRFSTWLFTIACRKAIDANRAARRRSAWGGEATGSAADPAPGPLASAIRREQAEADAGLWDLADRVLSPKQWTALWLHYGEDQSPAEVARAMHLPAVNARVLLHRARKTLGRALEKHEDAARWRPEVWQGAGAAG